MRSAWPKEDMTDAGREHLTAENGLGRALSRSHEFAERLLAQIDVANCFASGERAEAAGAAAELSFEHGHAMRVLLAAEAPNSAVSLLRLQYEALLRSGWLLYAASDDQVGKIVAPLTQETAAVTKNFAGADDMLRGLERALEAAPDLFGLVEPLRELRAEAWTVMNSFVHGGFHPIARTRDGFPVKLAIDVLKLSNGMLHMGARLLARLTGVQDVVHRVDHAYRDFEDVLPIVTPPAQKS